MITQTIYQAGNSVAVTIPKNILEELKLKVGQKVIVEKSTQSNSMIISPVVKVKVPNAIFGEFKKWLSGFLEEDKKLLQELANR